MITSYSSNSSHKYHHRNDYHAIETLIISLLPHIGCKRYWSLINHFGTATAILSTSPSDIPFLNQQGQHLLSNYQQQGEGSLLAEKARLIVESTIACGGHILTVESDGYPALLKEIDQPPPVLFVKGNIDALSLPQIALVGSRRSSHAGLDNTQRFAAHLASNGFTITSGLALGIDGAAHQAAINAQGTTVAVMATGIDDIYPKRHRHLADAIIDSGGALISEFTPHSAPKADHFPRRNRIISGLSLGVLVIEAAIKSGSLITARFALEQGREVFAIPGSIHHPQSKGCHQLIKQGATLVETSDDIVQQLPGIIGHLANQPNTHNEHSESTEENRILNCSKEKAVLDYLTNKPLTIDALITLSGLPSHELSAHLMNLEINGWIKHSEWGYERV